MSAGLPIISSPGRGVLADLLSREQCGLSYGIGDAEALANHLARVAEDRGSIRKLAENAAQVFREGSSPSKSTAT